TLPIALPVTNCSGSVTYLALTGVVDGNGGLTASGRGQASVVTGDVAMPVSVTMSLTGVPDQEAPRFGFSTNGDMTDPFNGFTVVASEPLPVDSRPTLMSTGGETI